MSATWLQVLTCSGEVPLMVELVTGSVCTQPEGSEALLAAYRV